MLLAPLDFVHRSQYLHARQTLERLLELGVVPVVNENDAVADEEIRFGDNDRLAALVAHLVRADLLVLLTDTAGLLTADPRRTGGRVAHRGGDGDRPRARAHRRRARAAPVGSGGMASKLAAAKIAVWSGVEAVIADAARPGVLAAVAGPPGVGTRFPPPRPPPAGPQAVDRLRHRRVGHHRRRRRRPAGPGRAGPSLLPAGVVVGPRGRSGSKTRSRSPARTARSSPRAWCASPAPVGHRWAGRRSEELPEDVAPEVVHRDDLVVLA